MENTPQTMLRVTHAEADQKLKVQISRGEQLLSTTCDTDEAFDQFRENKRLWSDFNQELLGALFTTTLIAINYANTRNTHGPFDDLHEVELQNLKEELACLRSIANRLELIPGNLTPQGETAHKTGKNFRKDQMQPKSRKVFIVHGHDEGKREAVARFLEQLNLQPIILHEQPSSGRTLIEKFEHNSDVGFAVVLLTADDFGYPKGEQSSIKPRARQNVVFELGYFFGRLSRKNVCTLYEDKVERPTDIEGLVYVWFDDSGAWKTELARELEAAGYKIDASKLL